jgi:hypothetical protein
MPHITDLIEYGIFRLVNQFKRGPSFDDQFILGNTSAVQKNGSSYTPEQLRKK